MLIQISAGNILTLIVSFLLSQLSRGGICFCLLICRIRNFIAMASSTSRAKKVWRKRKILPKKEPIGDNFGLSRKSPRCAQCLKFNADDPSKVGDDEVKKPFALPEVRL